MPAKQSATGNAMKRLDEIAAMEPEMRMLLAQVGRYAITGLAVTALQALAYWVLATWADWHPQLANFAGYLLAVSLGFVLHGAFTFRDHGSRDKPVLRGLKFILVSLISLGLNAIWVRSEEHTSELQSLMRISYAVLCLKQKQLI